MTTKKAAAAEAKPQKYTKVALAGSKRFQLKRDLINAILIDGEEYTIEEVENAIENYLKQEV